LTPIIGGIWHKLSLTQVKDGRYRWPNIVVSGFAADAGLKTNSKFVPALTPAYGVRGSVLSFFS
jgi:hypothetical protein